MFKAAGEEQEVIPEGKYKKGSRREQEQMNGLGLA